MPERIGVIGGGAVGLATAGTLQYAFPQAEIVLFEQHKTVGTETTARSSEVAHTPIQYTAQSFKEILCRAGGKLLKTFCAEHNVPYERTGKFIVATTEQEEGALENILAAAARTRTPAHLLTGREVREGNNATARPEPYVHCTRAVYLPDTAVFDTHMFVKALEYAFSTQGGIIVVGAPVTKVSREQGTYTIDGEPFDCIVNAAGLYAVDVAESAGMHQYADSVRFVKGEYWSILQQDVHALVYPVPTEHSLGVHFTRSVSGEARLGPGVEVLPYRSPREFPRDIYAVPDDANKRAQFLAAAQRYFPHLSEKDLTPGTSGIRPQRSVPKSQRDFIIQEETSKGFPRFVNLIGIESPGLTASLAIGEHVSYLLQK